MLAFVKGKLIEAKPLYIIIDTGNIGYMIQVPPSLHSHLPPIGDEVFLHTLPVIRENSHTLYGFATREDLEVFELLTTINGIGPKLAISIIGHLSGEELERTISEQDLATICRVPGVGKKTAERMIVELKGKLANKLNAPIGARVPPCQKSRDAMSALINLGYNQQQAEKAVKATYDELSEEADLPLFITNALKHVTKL